MRSWEKDRKQGLQKRKRKSAKTPEKFAKLHEQEKNLAVLEDMSVISALLIIALALVYVIDIARYQWVMAVILLLGLFLNLTLLLRSFLQKKWIFCGMVFLLMLGYLASLVCLLIL